MSLTTEAMPETRLHFYHFPAVSIDRETKKERQRERVGGRERDREGEGER